MKENILFALWFFLPAGLANATPVFAAKIPFLKNFDYPLDFYKKLNRERIFGSHKTFRGLTVGVLTGVLTVLLQVYWYNDSEYLRQFIPLNYSTINPLLLGILLSSGALAGDAFRSFFKRRAGIKPGGTWFPFDQLDYIVGGIIFSYFYIQLNPIAYVYVVIIWFSLHPITTTIGYLLKIREKPI